VESFVGLLRWLDMAYCAETVRNVRIQATSNPVAFAAAFRTEIEDELWNSLNLRQLTLDGFDLRDLYLSISSFTQVQSLTHLTLWNCQHASEFLSQLSYVLIQVPRLINLRHVAATFDRDDKEFDTCLESTFKICKLHSLHLVWEHPLAYPKATLAAMSLLSKSLQSFSLHYRGHNHRAEQKVFYIREGLSTLIGLCHNLYQLGIQVDEYYILPHWESGHASYWVCPARCQGHYLTN
jgi:hypothetical protein